MVGREGPPRKARVLVVEDDALIALEVARQLTDAGFEIVGPATSLAQALRLVDDQGCDAAVLDVNLGNNQTSEPIARKLRARNTPFIILSGYFAEQHPPGLEGAPRLSKPALPGDLVATLLRSMGDR